MTKMVIDYMARGNSNGGYKAYEIDRNEWQTWEDVLALADDCLTDEVFKVEIYEGENLMATVRH